MSIKNFHSTQFHTMLLGAGLILLLTGCGLQPRSHMERTQISAKITNGGVPLSGALIDFANAENGEAYGGTLDEDGLVALEDVALGNYTITIQPPPGDPVLEKPEKRARDNMNIPKEFFSPIRTPLQASVGDGDNNFVYDLKDFDLSKKR